MIEADLARFFILLAVFASVVIGSGIVMRSFADRRAHLKAINSRLKLIARGMDRDAIMLQLRKNDPMALDGHLGIFDPMWRGFRRNLTMAAITVGPVQIMMMMAVICIVLILTILLIAFVANYPLAFGIFQLVSAVAAAVSVILPLFVISYLAQRRRKRMQEQFPVALDVFVRALRAGHPVPSAIDLLTKEMEDPIGSEFGLVADEVSFGADIVEALHATAERWDLDDMRMFVVSLAVQNETGGNLAEILENLSRVIRERAGLFLKVRALSSEGRMTGWLLSILPVITFVALFLINPGFYLDVALDPIFYWSFPLLLIWYVIGVIMIRRIINIEV